MESNRAAEEKKKQGNEEHKRGHYSQAVSYYSEAICTYYHSYPNCFIELNPNEPSFYTNRAFSNIQLKNFKKAFEDCEQALRINPNFGRAHKRMYKCYLSIGELEVSNMIMVTNYLIESEVRAS